MYTIYRKESDGTWTPMEHTTRYELALAYAQELRRVLRKDVLIERTEDGRVVFEETLVA